MVSYIERGMQANIISKQDLKANTWAQGEWKWGVEKPQQ